MTTSKLQLKMNAATLMPLMVALCLLFAMLFIAKVHSYTSDTMLKRQFYEQGIALTHSLSNSIWVTLDREGNQSPQKILNSYDLTRLKEEIHHLIKGTPILKLKMFNADGKMKYSSNSKDVIYGDGDDLKVEKKVNLVALEVVNKNLPIASYRFRDSFDSGEKIYTDRYIFSSYIPVHVPGTDKIGAVVEIYYDVSSIINEFNANRNISSLMLVLTGLLLFVLISYLIIRNEKTSHHNIQEREKYLSLLTDKNSELTEKADELIRIKERTEKIAEERSIFMARMSHELRTPMNAVIGLTDLIMRTELSDRQQGYVNAIQSSGNILLDITDEILSIGRLETGFLEIKQQRFILRDVIDNVMEVMGNRASKQGVELICEYTPEIDSHVYCDPVRLRQVLINLLGNALKYTDEGYVKIRVMQIESESGIQHYNFEVSDSGIGIAYIDQQKIFAAYCYLHSQTGSQSRSTGLGLAISKRLVEAMNGVIGVDSEEGKGSIFWFTLPSITDNSSPPEMALFSEESILLIHQNSEAANSLLATLQGCGMQADLATTYEEVDVCFEQSLITVCPYSIFFIDYSVHGVSATRFAEKIRSHAAFKHACIVFIVPVSEPAAADIINSISNAFYINKPILPGELKGLMSRLVNKEAKEKKSTTLARRHRVGSAGMPGNKKVLVVEDNPVSREVLLEMLMEFNILAKGVENGHAALQVMLEEHFDLLLLDCRLPDMEGFEVAAKIRQIQAGGKQPVIIVTSSDCSLRNQQLCYESGVDDFLYKPIKMNNLYEMLFSWLPETGNIKQKNEMDDSAAVVNLFSAPVLDSNIVSNLKRHGTDNPEFFNQLITLFMTDYFERIEVLKSQLEQADYYGIEMSVHTLKSGCIYIGAMRMARYCEVLANMARNQSSHETRRALQHFMDEFDCLVLELERKKEMGSAVTAEE